MSSLHTFDQKSSQNQKYLFERKNRQNEEQAMDYLIYGASNKNELKKKSEISEQESSQEI